jgi:hypothetical protein
MESEYIARKAKLIEYIKEQIKLYEDDLDMTTEEDMASFYQGQLEAYEDMLHQIEEGL